MVLDLAGKTVTQAVDLLKSSLGQHGGEELEVRVDNEVVKLNVYNLVHKAGLRCKVQRQGTHYHFKIKVPKKHRIENRVETGPGKGKSAFPIGHVSARQRKAGTSKERPPEEKPGANPRKRPGQETGGLDLGTGPAPQVDGTGSHGELRWLVIQRDQIGQKDVGLGMELLEDLVDNLNPEQTSGLFLIHRGVRLLDPAFQGGRTLEAILRTSIKVKVCVRSAGFYGLLDAIGSHFELVPARELMDIIAQHNVTWI